MLIGVDSSNEKILLVLDTELGCPRLKQAAIFSDGVFPFGFNEEVAEILDRNPIFLPSSLLEKRGLLRRLRVKRDAVNLFLDARNVTRNLLGWRYDPDHGSGAFTEFWLFLGEVLNNFELPRSTPILSSPQDGYAAWLSPSRVEKASYSQSDFNGLEFGGVPLIDTAKLSWETVLAMREDTKLKSKMRNFYLFYEENYTGRDREFIEADLCRRVDEYQNAIKDWGFETLTGSISMILGTGAFAGAAGSIIAATMGVSALSVASIPIIGAAVGHTGLFVAKRSYERNKIIRDSPIRLFIDYPNVTKSV